MNNRYTDAPHLSDTPVISSFRLLFWLFFHPSAWRNHLAHIDPTLRPAFSLSELKRHQLAHSALWRTLLRLYLAWPILVALLLALLLRLLNLPSATILLGILIGVASGVVASLATSIAGSVALSVPIGIAVSLVMGSLGTQILASSGAPILFGRNAQLAPNLLPTAVLGLAGGLGGGLAYGVAVGIAGHGRITSPNISLTRQISGVIIGILIGISGGLLTGNLQGGLAIILLLGVPFGTAVAWQSGSWQRGVAAGLLIGLAGGLLRFAPENSPLSAARLFAFLALLTALFAVPYVFAERIAGSPAGALAGALGSSAGFLLFLGSNQSLLPVLWFALFGILLGLTLAWWRPIVTYPFLMIWNNLLLRLDERRLRQQRPTLLPRHSAFWDELQRLPLLNLDTHLQLVWTHQPDAAETAVAYLSTSNQRWAAQAAQIEMDARRLENCQTIVAIGLVYSSLAAGELAGPASALLRSFSRVSQDVEAAQQQESAYNRRLALTAVEDRLDGLLRELTRSTEPYAVRFQPIAAAWRQVIAAKNQALSEEAELRQEIDSPYIIGIPLTEQQEIFVGRTDISGRIEQLLLDRRQPPLLLYGQRRVGKTSLLNNLGRLLPTTIVPLFVDLQGPASRAREEAGFLYNMARSMRQSAQRRLTLPPLAKEELTADPFTRFEEWLDSVEAQLNGQIALLMLDEFEVLEQMFEKGRFDEAEILGMIRHLIQHRPAFKVLLSGSHTLSEFQRWASYLINVQVVHIGYLSAAEAKQLITAPVQGFALRYQPAASQRVYDLTQGHPFLVQLLCAEIVALKNEQPPAKRRQATLADVNTAVAPALAHGSFFFADIETNQVDDVGREVLRLLATQGEFGLITRQQLVNYFPSLMALEAALRQLQQRELLTAVGDGYQFQVELIRCWFAQSA